MHNAPDSTTSMTNIEAYTGYRERQRVQTNQPSSAFSRQEDGLFVRPRYPEPGLGGCEAYSAPTLAIENGLGQDFQCILDEDPNLDPQIVELRRLTRERKALEAQYRERLAKEYKRLVAECRVRKTYWHAGPVKRRWRKPWFEKQWVGWRWVMKKQYLKPRVIAYRALVSFDLSTGVKTYETRRKTITPYRWVEVRKPKFSWRLKRPGGLVPYKPRVSEERLVTDWNEVRRLFATFKLQLIPDRLKILNLRQRCIQLRRTLIRRPKLAASWTTSGYVQPPTITVPVALPYAGSVNSLGYLWQQGIGRFSYPAYIEDGRFYSAVDLLCPEALGWGATYAEALEMAKERSYIPHGVWRTVGVEPDRCRLRLDSRKKVDLIADGDALVDAATTDSQKELRAYATLVSLTKAEDYTFQLVRSIGELKDARGTFKQAWDFLKWLKRPTVKGLTPKKVYAGIAGAYLAWKFAIEPTIQDVQTVTDNTVSFLTDIRRSLRALVDDLVSGTSIYHARAAYASAKGMVSGRVRLHADNASFGEVQYSLSWTRRYRHPLTALAMYRTSTPDGSLNCTAVEDPTQRGATILSFAESEYPPTFSASIEEEADDGRKWSRTFDSSMTWIYDGDPFEDNQSSTGAQEHCHRVQQLHAFPLPYDFRDVATGVLFASYHADEIVQLATDGRLDLGTIADYMNQLVAVESWLKNPGAQLAVGKELLRHTDLPFVAWQLTPLSFIYDWFTTSGTIVEALNSLARTTLEVIPQPLHGVWQSERHELLSIVPNLRLKERKCWELVREWSVVEVSRRNEPHYYAAPSRSTIFNDYTWEPSPGTAVASRTGLYRFRRGEYEPHGLDDADVYMPKLRLGIDRDKLVTLSAMIGGFV